MRRSVAVHARPAVMTSSVLSLKSSNPAAANDERPKFRVGNTVGLITEAMNFLEMLNMMQVAREVTSEVVSKEDLDIT